MGIEAKADLPAETDIDAVYSNLVELATDPEVPVSRLAVKGVEAYWHAFRCRYPAMLTVGKDMLRRVEQEGLEAVGDGDLYYNARATAAFHDVYADWAADEAANADAVGSAHQNLLPVLDELLRAPYRGTVTGSYLRRIGLMAFAARARGSLVIFPPPPILHRRAGPGLGGMLGVEDVPGAVHTWEEVDAFISMDGELVGARLPKVVHDGAGHLPSVSVAVDQVYWSVVRDKKHPFMREFEGLSVKPRLNETTRHVVDLLVREGTGILRVDENLLNAITQKVIRITRNLVEGYERRSSNTEPEA